MRFIIILALTLFADISITKTSPDSDLSFALSTFNFCPCTTGDKGCSNWQFKDNFFGENVEVQGHRSHCTLKVEEASRRCTQIFYDPVKPAINCYNNKGKVIYSHTPTKLALKGHKKAYSHTVLRPNFRVPTRFRCEDKKGEKFSFTEHYKNGFSRKVKVKAGTTPGVAGFTKVQLYKLEETLLNKITSAPVKQTKYEVKKAYKLKGNLSIEKFNSFGRIPTSENDELRMKDYAENLRYMSYCCTDGTYCPENLDQKLQSSKRRDIYGRYQ